MALWASSISRAIWLTRVPGDMVDPRIVGLAAVGKRHTAGGSRQQPDVEVGFQAVDVLAGRGRADAQPSGRSGDAAGIHGIHEAFDGTQSIHRNLSD